VAGFSPQDIGGASDEESKMTGHPCGRPGGHSRVPILGRHLSRFSGASDWWVGVTVTMMVDPEKLRGNEGQQGSEEVESQ
jgi:hypothetical protein